MTKEEFNSNWTLLYPGTAAISHLFKQHHFDRWFRIHSLPESKRYAENDNDWEILLKRQNEIITDLLGHDTIVFVVTGEFIWGNEKTCHLTDEDEVYKAYTFTLLDNIDLHKYNSQNYDDGEIYKPAFTQTIWKPNEHDKLLREIANDNTRAFFVSFEKNVIVAPYDGGIDFVLKDSLTKDFYKDKYSPWLSKREDGL